MQSTAKTSKTEFWRLSGDWHWLQREERHPEVIIMAMESIVSLGLMRCVLYWDEDSDDGRWAHYWYSARELNSKFQPDNNSLRIKFHHQPLEENKLSLDWVGGTSSSAQQAACQLGVIILMGVYIDFYTRQRWWSNSKQSRHHDCVWLCDGCSARFGFAHVCCTDGPRTGWDVIYETILSRD